MVVELAVDSKALQERETCLLPVHDLSPRFEFARERLHFLVWANNYDARNGEPIWWHGRKALRSFRRRRGCRSRTAPTSSSPTARLSGSTVDRSPPPPAPTGSAIVHRWNTEAGSLSPIGHQPPEADLAADQLAAVSHPAGGARVIAPAGSGKTRVLTERLRYLLDDSRRGPVDRDGAGLQQEGGGRAPGALRRPRHGARSPHPDAQQRRLLHLQRVRRAGTAGRPGGAPCAGSGAAGLRGPPPGQHRHRAPLHRRAVRRPARD